MSGRAGRTGARATVGRGPLRPQAAGSANEESFTELAERLLSEVPVEDRRTEDAAFILRIYELTHAVTKPVRPHVPGQRTSPLLDALAKFQGPQFQRAIMHFEELMSNPGQDASPFRGIGLLPLIRRFFTYFDTNIDQQLASAVAWNTAGMMVVVGGLSAVAACIEHCINVLPTVAMSNADWLDVLKGLQFVLDGATSVAQDAMDKIGTNLLAFLTRKDANEPFSVTNKAHRRRFLDTHWINVELVAARTRILVRFARERVYNAVKKAIEAKGMQDTKDLRAKLQAQKAKILTATEEVAARRRQFFVGSADDDQRDLDDLAGRFRDMLTTAGTTDIVTNTLMLHVTADTRSMYGRTCSMIQRNWQAIVRAAAPLCNDAGQFAWAAVTQAVLGATVTTALGVVAGVGLEASRAVSDGPGLWGTASWANYGGPAAVVSARLKAFGNEYEQLGERHVYDAWMYPLAEKSKDPVDTFTAVYPWLHDRWKNQTSAYALATGAAVVLGAYLYGTAGPKDKMAVAREPAAVAPAPAPSRPRHLNPRFLMFRRCTDSVAPRSDQHALGGLSCPHHEPSEAPWTPCCG